MEIAVLGSLSLTHEGRQIVIDGGRAQSLFIALLVRGGEVVTTDALVEHLWGDRPPSSATASVQAYVSRLRRDLRPTGLQVPSRKPGYRLDLASHVVDAARFEALVARGREALRRGGHARCSTTLRQALGLWRGAAYAGFADQPLVREEAARLEEVHLQARELRLHCDLMTGAYAESVVDLEQLVGEHPLRESLWVALMAALFGLGRRADALHAYQRARKMLRQELGLAPGSALGAAHTAVLNDLAPTLETGRAPSPSGLRTTLPSSSREANYLPAHLARPEVHPLVGRSAVLADLKRSWSDNGGPSVVLVSGAAGSGKSRLARELAVELAAEGASVLWGAASRESEMPYEAFVAAVRDHVARMPEQGRPTPEGPGGALLAAIVPELPSPVVGGPGGAPLFRRYLFFEAVTSLLLSAATSTRALVVLDDLQWADRSTTLLLTHIARHPRARELLVLVLRRSGVASTQAGWEQDPADLEDVEGEGLKALERAGLMRHLPLPDLDAVSACNVVRTVLGGDVDQKTLHVLVTGAGGNPFHLVQAAKTLAELGHGTNSQHAAPDTATETLDVLVARRLARLPAQTRTVLGVGAMIGEVFTLDVIAAVLDHSTEDVGRFLLPGLASGVLVGGARPDAYAFSHALLRESVLRGLPSERRSLWHRAISTHLLSGREADAPPLDQLLHHLRHALMADVDKVVELTTQAGDRALTLLSFTEAARHYESAMSLLPISEADGLRRCRLLLALGEARLAEYEPTTVRDTFGSAAHLALTLGAPQELRRAVVGLVAGTEFGTVDESMGTLLTAALERPEFDGVAVRAIARAALARLLPPGDARLAECARDAAILVESTDDEHARAFVLLTLLLVTWGRSSPEARRDTATAVLGAARSCGDRESEMEALNLRSAAAWELGDRVAAESDLALLSTLSAESQRPFFQALTTMRRASSALATGRYEDAEALTGRLGPAASRSSNFQAAQLAQSFAALRDRGRTAALEPVVRAVVELTDAPAWRAVAAVIDLELERPDRCLAALHRFRSEGLDHISGDWLRLPTLAYLAEVAAALGDAAAADELFGELAPFRSRNVVVAHGLLTTGSAARNLAVLAAVLGRTTTAEALFEQALADNISWKLRPWVVRTRLAYAEFLERASSPARAAQHRRQGLSEARALGMDGVMDTRDGARWLSREITMPAAPEESVHHRGSRDGA